MIDQIIPLGELGVLVGIFRRLGQLRDDTDSNERAIGKLRNQIGALKSRVASIENDAGTRAARSGD